MTSFSVGYSARLKRFSLFGGAKIGARVKNGRRVLVSRFFGGMNLISLLFRC